MRTATGHGIHHDDAMNYLPGSTSLNDKTDRIILPMQKHKHTTDDQVNGFFRSFFFRFLEKKKKSKYLL